MRTLSDARARLAARTAVEVTGVLEDQTFRQQDDRLGCVDQREAVEQSLESVDRSLAVLSHPVDHERHVGEDLAGALVEGRAFEATALARNHAILHDLIVLENGADGFEEPDVELAFPALCGPDHQFHGPAHAGAVHGEVDRDARSRVGEEGDPVEGRQAVEEPRGGLEQLSGAAGLDVELIHRQHHQACGRGRLVGGEGRFEGLRGEVASDCGQVEGHLLQGHHPTGPSVDAYAEVGCGQVVHGSPGPVQRRDVDRDDIDARAEGRHLGRRGSCRRRLGRGLGAECHRRHHDEDHQERAHHTLRSEHPACARMRSGLD
jgi:hypothetical protein